MEKVKLFLFTNGYPYGKGEKPFIEPEINALKDIYELTIVSYASPEKIEDKANYTNLDEKIKNIRIQISDSKASKIFGSILAFFDPKWIREFNSILKARQNIIARIKESLSFYVCAKKIYRWIKQSGIFDGSEKSIAYSFWNTTYALALCWYKQRHGKFSLVTRVHGYDLFNERVKRGQRQPYKCYMDSMEDMVFFASEDGYDYYVNHFAAEKDSEKYRLLRLGVPELTVNGELARGRRFELVSCSNLIPLKRVDLIIKALAQLPDRVEIKWTHFGTGALQAELEELACEMLGEKTGISYEFAGFVKNEELLRLYSSKYVDCFIALSSSEGGCPVSVMEAMSAGIPIIATNVGGMAEEVFENGILLEANPEIEEIRNAIISIYDKSDEETILMRNASRSIWNERFNQEKNINSLVQVLGSL